MPYDYQIQRKELFSDEGQRLFLAVRNGVCSIIGKSGAITMGKAMAVKVGMGYDGWTFMACIDRMVELGELREIAPSGPRGQDRVFVEG